MLNTYYHPLMVPDIKLTESFSKSPSKPKLVTDSLCKSLNALEHKVIEFDPYTKDDFLLAHTNKYVDSIFNLKGPAEFELTHSFVTSLTYTNASLYNSILGSINKPYNLHLSPVSGMHHATPYQSMGFCTFSGQVIASTKLYRDKGLVGCYLDLDAHFGNSIEDSRNYVKDLNSSIPEWANFNPQGFYDDYIVSFKKFLYDVLEVKIMNKECDYIVYCHGADSILGDDSCGGKVSLLDWYKCTNILFDWYNQLCKKLDKPIPISMALFGGYRADDYNYIINAHTTDIILALTNKIKF